MKDIEGFHILWTAPYFEKVKITLTACRIMSF